MRFAFLITSLTLFFGIYVFFCNFNEKSNLNTKAQRLPLILSAGFFVRIVFAFLYSGHPTDMACFNSWSDMLKTDGFSAFYTSDAFTDYPPGYMYILYILSFIKDIFGYDTIFTYVILKLPAIISDLFIGYLIYKICEKYDNNKSKILLCSFFVFNPAVILNSSVWGQVDSVFTALVVLTLYLMTCKKTILAYFVYAITLFIKPQALFYAPVILCGIIENVFINNFSSKKLLLNIIGAIMALSCLVVLSVPFGINNVAEQYINTLASYNYASVNAYNLWTALGLNWSPVTPVFSFFGYMFITLIVILCIYLFFKKTSKNKFFILSAFICFAVFTLSVKMHERYAFPVIALLLCAYAISSKKEEMYLYFGVSMLQFVNTFDVLFFYDPAYAFEPSAVFIYALFGLLTLPTLFLFLTYLVKGNLKLNKCFNIRKNEHLSTLFVREKIITKKDKIIMTVITVIYSFFALYNLGNLNYPETSDRIGLNKPSMVFELEEEASLSKINFYLGHENINKSNALEIKTYDVSGNKTFEKTITNANVFCWESCQVDSFAKRIEFISDSLSLYEIGIFSENGELLPVINGPDELFDEQEKVPFAPSYRDGTYFDEIYHARTAYELIHKLPIYEWTHPPLGKELISLGISIFGMSPFGWRIIGTLFGIFMIPILYIFSKKLFGITWISALSAIVFSSDFMHFSQTRIATIDVYVTFFIMLMYLFMYKYIDEYDDSSLKKSLLALAFSGFFMGFGISSKWTGVYAGAGLAVIFFSFILTRYYRKQISTKTLNKTIYYCIIFFVFIPVLIYIVSYIPFLRANNEGFYGIIQNQIDMFSYHGDTVVSSTHPFSSPWYQWIFNIRPIWYYSGSNGDLSENISAFGNPALWIAGFVAFIFCSYDSVVYRNKNAGFLVVSYLAQLLPWIFVERTTFIYHYFPCVPFMVLMIAHAVQRIYVKNKNIKKYFIGFTILCVLLFILFYPVISGYPVNGDFVRDYLRWLPSWQLIN